MSASTSSGPSFTRFGARDKTKMEVPLGKPVNPKVFFANERCDIDFYWENSFIIRTFLHWMQFCSILAFLSIGLVDYGDSMAQVGGLIFTLVSLGLMFYALVKYHERSNRLAKKGEAFVKSGRYG